MWDLNTLRRLNGERIEEEAWKGHVSRVNKELSDHYNNEAEAVFNSEAVNDKPLFRGEELNGGACFPTSLQIEEENHQLEFPDFKIEILEGGKMPTKAHLTDACWDCYARIEQPRVKYLKGQSWGLIKLGFKIEIPEGWELQIRGRSGMAFRGTFAHFGTVDHSYREEVGVILFTKHDISIVDGYRVCQMAFAPVYGNRLVKVDKVTPSDRGGFGSTGK